MNEDLKALAEKIKNHNKEYEDSKEGKYLVESAEGEAYILTAEMTNENLKMRLEHTLSNLIEILKERRKRRNDMDFETKIRNFVERV